MSDQAILALTREMRAAREDLKAIRSKGENGVPRGWIKWILGILGVLIAAGVVSNIRTYSDVQALTVNVQLFRAEVQREFDRQEREMTSLTDKVDRQIRANRGGNEQ